MKNNKNQPSFQGNYVIRTELVSSAGKIKDKIAETFKKYGYEGILHYQDSTRHVPKTADIYIKTPYVQGSKEDETLLQDLIDLDDVQRIWQDVSNYFYFFGKDPNGINMTRASVKARNPEFNETPVQIKRFGEQYDLIANDYVKEVYPVGYERKWDASDDKMFANCYSAKEQEKAKALFFYPED